MTFEESLAYIASLEPRGWRLGLDRMQAFLNEIGLSEQVKSPQRNFVHIAGTNGKGSTAFFVQNLLLSHGSACGIFLSPYVYDPRERIMMNGEMISKELFTHLVAKLISFAESFETSSYGGITEFEFKTAMGFQFWVDQKAPYVSLETGLGGRLDATNVVTPVVSIITSISLDHQAILGHTEREIAFEKAGIIKPNVPAVVGKVSDEAFDSISKKAQEVDARLFRFGFDFGIDIDGNFYSPWKEKFAFPVPKLEGKMQLINLSVAVAGLLATGVEVSTESIQEVAQNTVVPGRFEVRRYGQTEIILDGAHNIASASHVRQTFKNRYGDKSKAIVLSNMVRGHDTLPFYAELREIIGKVIVPPITFFRAKSPSETVSELAKIGIEAQEALGQTEGIEVALNLATIYEMPVLVTGSFYLVGEVGNFLTKNGIHGQSNGIRLKSAQLADS